MYRVLCLFGVTGRLEQVFTGSKQDCLNYLSREYRWLCTTNRGSNIHTNYHLVTDEVFYISDDETKIVGCEE